MGEENERKFLLSSDAWRAEVIKRFSITQGYLCIEEEIEVRVRRKNGAGTVTVKGKRVNGKRPEYEADLKPGDADELLGNECMPTLIKKIRHEIKRDSLKWEVDVFQEENEGLTLAEVELPEGETEVKVTPEWLGEEVTRDDRYYNQYLSLHPFTAW